MGFLGEDGEFLPTSKQYDLETRVCLAIMQDVINFIARTKEITIGNADEEIYNITRDEFQKGLEEVRKLHEEYEIDYREILPKD